MDWDWTYGRMDSLLRTILLPHYSNTEMSTTRTRGQSLLTVRMKNGFAVHITVCLMCHMRLIGHIIHGIQQLLDAFTGITTFCSASCAIQSLSDPIHRPVTTHALSKGDRLQYVWSRPFLSTQTDPTVLLKVAGDGWGLSRPWVKSGSLRLSGFGLD